MEINRATNTGFIAGSHSIGDLSIAADGKLTVNADHRNYLTVHNLSLAGALRINDTAVMVTGTFTGGGALKFGATTQAPELFTSGLIFANGLSQTIGNPVSADDAAAGGPTLAVGDPPPPPHPPDSAGGARAAHRPPAPRGPSTTIALTPSLMHT